MVLSVLLSPAVVRVQTRSRIKLGAFDVGMRCSEEQVTTSVRRSSATVTNVVSSLTYRLMRLHRLLSVDLVKPSVPDWLQAGHPRVPIK